MCDVCIKRGRAYESLSVEDQAAVDEMAAQWMPQLSILRDTNPEAFETGFMRYGESLDIMLGLTPAFTDEELFDLGETPEPTAPTAPATKHTGPLVTRWWKWW